MGIAKEIDDPDLIAGYCGCLINTYHRLAKPNQALEIYEEVLDIAKKYNNSILKIQPSINIATMFQTLGNLKKARGIYEETLDIVEGFNMNFEGTLNFNIGVNYILCNEYSKSIEFIRRGLDIAIKSGNKELEVYCYLVLFNLLYIQNYSPNDLIELGDQALDIARKSSNKELEIKIEVILGLFNFSQGNTDKALELGQSVLRLSKENEIYNSERFCLFLIGIYYYRFNPETSLHYLNKSIELNDSISNMIFKEKDKIEFFAFLPHFSVYESIISLCLRENKKTEAVEYLEKNKSRVLLNLLSVGEIKPHCTNNKELDLLIEQEQTGLKMNSDSYRP